MLTLEIVWGTDETWDLEARTAVDATTDLLVSDVYSAKVSQRPDSPTLFAPVVAFLSASTVNMTITGAQSAGLNGGEAYPGKIYRTRAAVTNCIGLFTLNCLSAPRS